MSRPTTPTKEFFSNVEGFLKKFKLTTESQRDQKVLTLSNLDSGIIRKFIVKKVDERSLFRRSSQKSLKDENENKSKKNKSLSHNGSIKKKQSRGTPKPNDGKRRLSASSLQSLKSACNLRRFGSRQSLEGCKGAPPHNKKRRSSLGSTKFRIGWRGSSSDSDTDDIFGSDDEEMIAKDRNDDKKDDPGFTNVALVKEDFDDESVELKKEDDSDTGTEKEEMDSLEKNMNGDLDDGSMSSMDSSSPPSSPRFKLKMSPVPKRSPKKKSDDRAPSPVSFRSGYQSNRSSISSVRKGILKKTNSCTTINMEMANLSRPQTPTDNATDPFEETFSNGDASRFCRNADNPHLNHQRSFNRVKFILDSGRPDNITGDYDDIKMENKLDKLDREKNRPLDKTNEKGLSRGGRKCVVFSAGLLIMTMAVILGSFFGSRKTEPPKALARSRANAVEGKFKILNQPFYPSLYNPESSDFKTMSKALEDVMIKAIFLDEAVTQPNSTIKLRVVKYEKGSVIAVFRIKWENSPQLKPAEIRYRVMKHLGKYGAFGDYSVDPSSFSITELKDWCEQNKQACSHSCRFNEDTLRFDCSCPDNLILINSTTCVPPDQVSTTTPKVSIQHFPVLSDDQLNNVNLVSVKTIKKTDSKNETASTKKDTSDNKNVNETETKEKEGSQKKEDETQKKDQNETQEKDQEESQKKEDETQKKDKKERQEKDPEESQKKEKEEPQKKEKEESQKKEQGDTQKEDQKKDHEQPQKKDQEKTQKKEVEETQKKDQEKSQHKDPEETQKKDQGETETKVQEKSQKKDQGVTETKDQEKSQKKDQGESETKDQEKSQKKDQGETEAKDQEKSQKKDQGETETKDQEKSQKKDQEKTQKQDQGEPQNKTKEGTDKENQKQDQEKGQKKNQDETEKKDQEQPQKKGQEKTMVELEKEKTEGEKEPTTKNKSNNDTNIEIEDIEERTQNETADIGEVPGESEQNRTNPIQEQSSQESNVDGLNIEVVKPSTSSQDELSETLPQEGPVEDEQVVLPEPEEKESTKEVNNSTEETKNKPSGQEAAENSTTSEHKQDVTTPSNDKQFTAQEDRVEQKGTTEESRREQTANDSTFTDTIEEHSEDSLLDTTQKAPGGTNPLNQLESQDETEDGNTNTTEQSDINDTETTQEVSGSNAVTVEKANTTAEDIVLEEEQSLYTTPIPIVDDNVNNRKTINGEENIDTSIKDEIAHSSHETTLENVTSPSLSSPADTDDDHSSIGSELNSYFEDATESGIEVIPLEENRITSETATVSDGEEETSTKVYFTNRADIQTTTVSDSVILEISTNEKTTTLDKMADEGTVLSGSNKFSQDQQNSNPRKVSEENIFSDTHSETPSLLLTVEPESNEVSNEKHPKVSLSGSIRVSISNNETFTQAEVENSTATFPLTTITDYVLSSIQNEPDDAVGNHSIEVNNTTASSDLEIKKKSHLNSLNETTKYDDKTPTSEIDVSLSTTGLFTPPSLPPPPTPLASTREIYKVSNAFNNASSVSEPAFTSTTSPPSTSPRPKQITKVVLAEELQPQKTQAYPGKEISTILGVITHPVTTATTPMVTPPPSQIAVTGSTLVTQVVTQHTHQDPQIDLELISNVSHDLSVPGSPHNQSSLDVGMKDVLAVEVGNVTAVSTESVSTSSQVSSTSSTTTIPPCKTDEFQCSDGFCIPKEKQCDSVNDCADQSDEVECVQNKCMGNYQCRWSGDCLARKFVCDGIRHCTEGADEEGCETWKCNEDEFPCNHESSSTCIPLSRKCDGYADCFNRSDELNCTSECGKDEFLCSEGSCIPNLWKCDGRADCLNGEDEKECECEGLDHSPCAVGGCVPTFKICDGLRQCPDGSDEWGCLRIDNDTKQLQVRSSDGRWSAICGDQWTAQWTDLVCEQLGFGVSLSTEIWRVSESVLLPRVGLSPDATKVFRREMAPLQYFLTHSDCSNEHLVHVSCNRPECGHWNISATEPQLHRHRDESTPWPSLGLLIKPETYKDTLATHDQACTASVITPTWVLTSYSCLVSKANGLEAQEWALLTGEASPKAGNGETQLRYARQIVVNPGAKRVGNFWLGDAALLRLQKPVTLNPSVQPICLAQDPPASHDQCVVGFWKPFKLDTPEETEGRSNQTIQNLPIPNLTLNTCNSSYYNGQLKQGHLCASFLQDHNSPCSGNESAPLMCRKKNGPWYLHGLLSHTGSCASFNLPSIFTDVSSIHSWLFSTIGRPISESDPLSTTTSLALTSSPLTISTTSPSTSSSSLILDGVVSSTASESSSLEGDENFSASRKFQISQATSNVHVMTSASDSS